LRSGRVALTARLGALTARLGTLTARLGALTAQLGTLTARLMIERRVQSTISRDFEIH